MLHLMLLNECLLHFLCYHDGVMMSFDSSCNFHHCCDDCWLSVYYNGTKQISIFQKVGKSTFYQEMKYCLLQ